jgi:CRP-like cAMP-binding protein
MINFTLLSRSPIFGGIPENEIEKLLNEIHYQLKNFKKEDLVALAGDFTENLYIVLSGSVRGEIIDYNGNTIKIEDIEAPRPLATAFLFGKENHFPVTVTANEATKILAIPVSEFMKLLQRNTQILKNFLDSISSRNQFLTQKLRFLNYKTIREKVAYYFLQQIGDRHHSIELQGTQQQLSELFGVTRPSLARVLSDMQREKLFIIKRKTVTLLDKPRLNKILQNG